MTNYLDATLRKNTSTIPVWFMRQAGRYLPEYRALKEKYTFHQMSHQPELISEITLQPFQRFDLDAAILFSDILTPLEYMGAAFHFGEQGPKLEKPGAAVLENLKPLNPEKNMSFVRDAIRIIKQKLDRPLIGFVGAPFTLASYLVEGGTSKEFHTIKNVLFQNSKLFNSGMDFLAREIGDYLVYQVESGADSVQIFDSWVGVLGAEDYKTHILPHMKTMVQLVKSKTQVPVTVYSQPTTHLLNLLVQTGADVLSVDWRLPLTEVARRTEHKVALQGNLDPLVTCLSWTEAKPHVDKVLENARNAEILDRFIFNVGHGVTPQTNTDTIKHIIDYIHEFKK